MITEEKLDKEWMRLIVKAKQMGISANEIRTFLRQPSEMEETSTKSEK